MRLGARVRAIRNARGLTLADVAGDQVSIGLLSKLERDLVQPSLETLVFVAERLGVPAASLLVTEREREEARSRGTLAAGRAQLLLGDPAGAARLAAEAMAATGGDAAVRARLLALAAEASLLAGGAAESAAQVRDASLVAPDVRSRVEIAWVLGALERRRGALADAERTWLGCLEALEAPADAHPWWAYLRASVLAELGGLAEARGDLERARNLVARAASIAAGMAQASAPAAALLADWSPSAPAAQNQPHDLPGQPDEPSVPAAALALAVIAAAERLSRRLALESARLERAVWAPEARALAPDAPASRGLRRA